LDGAAKGFDQSVDLPIDFGDHLVDGVDLLQRRRDWKREAG
jgi:hypothetical protein